MGNKEHHLTQIWEKYPEIFSPKGTSMSIGQILEILSEIFIIGKYYYYVINIPEQTLSHQDANLCATHGLCKDPTHLQEILDLIHPDDINFVLKAEEYCYGKLIEVGKQNIKSLKSCYCFRMRMADGSYHLYHHQAITLLTDENNRIVKSLNIHTDINHITPKNNYIATLIGTNGCTDFYQEDLTEKLNLPITGIVLTKRELEILPFIAEGFSSQKIAERLEISVETVRVHRKNILRKTNTHNSSSLVKNCIELGIL